MIIKYIISIHAPLTGSDFFGELYRIGASISIHAPLTGSDDNAIDLVCDKKIFQSTLPSQGATVANMRNGMGVYISIHAPLTGSDTPCCRHLTWSILFQSTLPSQGATSFTNINS